MSHHVIQAKYMENMHDKIMLMQIPIASSRFNSIKVLKALAASFSYANWCDRIASLMLAWRRGTEYVLCIVVGSRACGE